MDVAFEYYDEGDDALRTPDTYIGKTPMDMVRQFHRVMGHSLDHPYIQNSDLDRLRLKLLQEEFDEVCAAETSEEVVKELCDVLYVAYGYAASFGWDLDAAFRRVHASNMSKLDDDGAPIVRSDGKIMKGPNYEAPDLSDLA